MVNVRGPGENGDSKMDERMRNVEGDLHTLKDWRNRTVDPWIESGSEFRKGVGTFMDRLAAQEELRQQLSDERHQANSGKLNMIIAIGTILLVVFTALLAVATYQMAHQHSFLNLPKHTRVTPTETAHFAGGIGNAHF